MFLDTVISPVVEHPRTPCTSQTLVVRVVKRDNGDLRTGQVWVQ